MLNGSCFIIAEAGVNHNGDINIAKKLVDAACDAGADAVKFQTFKTEKLVTKSAEMAEYQKKNTLSSETQFQMLKRLELSFEDHVKLYDYCLKKSIMFLSTPFDFESVDLLCRLKVKMFKVSSGDLTNLPLLKYIASKEKKIILSTGMADLGEIEDAVNCIESMGNSDIVLMHCTSNYPAKYESVNLNAIKTLKSAFSLPVGYSDHTQGIEVPIASVALGADVIEKHFTLDRNMEGPDHKASLEPKDLKKMVSSIRNIEKAMGSGIKKCSKDEENVKIAARKSIVAAKDIAKGKIIKLEDIDYKRPGNGLLPKYYTYVVGKKARCNIKVDEKINFGMIE